MFKIFKKNKDAECAKKDYVEKEELNNITERYDRIVEELRGDINMQRRIVEELRGDINMQRRIIKYSKEVPTFNFDYGYSSRFMFSSTKENTISLYIDKNEYRVYLKELDDENVSNKNCKLSIKDNLAYLDVKVNNYNEGNETLYMEFIIDYSKLTYVATSKWEEKENK